MPSANSFMPSLPTQSTSASTSDAVKPNRCPRATLGSRSSQFRMTTSRPSSRERIVALSMQPTMAWKVEVEKGENRGRGEGGDASQPHPVLGVVPPRWSCARSGRGWGGLGWGRTIPADNVRPCYVTVTVSLISSVRFPLHPVAAQWVGERTEAHPNISRVVQHHVAFPCTSTICAGGSAVEKAARTRWAAPMATG